MSDLLHARGITKRFGGLIAVNHVEFTIPEKAIISLIGPNGAGKTTFFNIIAGIYDPTAGEIDFGGETVIAHSRRAWLEPIIWVLPAAIVGTLAVILDAVTGNENVGLIGLALTVLMLMIVLLIGVSRPPSYQRFLRRGGA